MLTKLEVHRIFVKCLLCLITNDQRPSRNHNCQVLLDSSEEDDNFMSSFIAGDESINGHNIETEVKLYQ